MASLGIVALLAVLCVVMFRYLRIFLFDQSFATMNGLSVSALDTLTFIAVALVVVLSFKALGAILVISLLVCPAAAVRIHIKSLRSFMIGSVVLGASIACISYVIASFAPAWLGYQHSLHVGSVTACICGVSVFMSIMLKRLGLA